MPYPAIVYMLSYADCISSNTLLHWTPLYTAPFLLHNPCYGTLHTSPPDYKHPLPYPPSTLNESLHIVDRERSYTITSSATPSSVTLTISILLLDLHIVLCCLPVPLSFCSSPPLSAFLPSQPRSPLPPQSNSPRTHEEGGGLDEERAR